MAGETRTEVKKKALKGTPRNRARRRKFLEEKVWPTLPPNERGRAMSKCEKEKILGYGPQGV